MQYGGVRASVCDCVAVYQNIGEGYFVLHIRLYGFVFAVSLVNFFFFLVRASFFLRGTC